MKMYKRRKKGIPQHDKDSSTLRTKSIFNRDLDIVEGNEGCSSSW